MTDEPHTRERESQPWAVVLKCVDCLAEFLGVKTDYVVKSDGQLFIAVLGAPGRCPKCKNLRIVE